MTAENSAAKRSSQDTELKQLVVAGIHDKRGQAVVSIDLQHIEEAVCDHFVVCHASSTTQTKAIAESVLKKVETVTGEKPWRKEGFQNLEWVLIDYVNVVVHIFLKEKRDYYALEELWADGTVTEYDDVV